MREYELMFVLTPELQEDGVTAAAERVTSLITNRGGEITKVDTWGRRRMAYPIRHQLDGLYTVMRFRLEANLTDELDRNLRLNESVLRHLIVRAEEVRRAGRQEAPGHVQPHRVVAGEPGGGQRDEEQAREDPAPRPYASASQQAPDRDAAALGALLDGGRRASRRPARARLGGAVTHTSPADR